MTNRYLERLSQTNTTTPPPITKPNRYLQRLKESKDKLYEESQEKEEAKIAKDQLPKLTQSDLLEDRFLDTIKDYMEEREGIDELSGLTDKEIVTSFVNKMRRFQAGQSVVTIGEVAWLNKADENTRQVAGEAYKLFDNMENIFTGERSTFLERLDAVGDYARAAIIDPANIIGIGAGKAVTFFGAKTAAKKAKQLAIQATAQKLLEKKGSQLTQKKALELATKKPEIIVDGVAKRVTAKEAERYFVKKGMQDFAEQEGKKRIGKELFAAGVTDMSVSVGVDFAYQTGMIKSMQQDEYSQIQSGMAALGGIIAPAYVGLTKKFKREDKQIYEKLRAEREAKLKDAAKNFSVVMTPFMDALEKGMSLTVKQKEQQGKLVREFLGPTDSYAEYDFFKTFMFGNDELGIQGIVHNLKENGVQVTDEYLEQNFENNFGKFLADVVSQMSPQDMGRFVSTLKKADVKKRLPDFNRGLKEYMKERGIPEGAKIEDEEIMEFFSGYLSSYASLQGRGLQLFSRGRQELGAKGLKTAKAGEVLDESLEPLKSDMILNILTGKKGIEKRVDYVQRNVIRNLVTNPGTTALNIIGWSNYSVLQTTTDFIRSALYVPQAFMQATTGRTTDAKKTMQTAKLMLGLQRDKLKNVLDPQSTYEDFTDYLAVRPDVQDRLMRYISGGVDSKEMIKDLGFDPMENVFFRSGEKYTNFFQALYGVQAQDVLTKSIEFMYNIDKNIRRKYNMTYDDFINSGNMDDIMSTKEYIALESRAVEDTLKSVFGKKYGKMSKEASYVEKAAYIIEEARRFPVFGLALPFGQFFNNTVAFFMDYSGLNAPAKLWNRGAWYRQDKIKKQMLETFNAENGYDPVKTRQFLDEIEERMQKQGIKIIEDKPDEAVESIIKGAVGLSLISQMAKKEEEYIEAGLSWDQERGSGGETVTKQYDFPESLFKYAARIKAHRNRGEETPRDLKGIFWDVFGLGQVDRSLGVYERGIGNILISMEMGDLEGLVKAGKDIAGEVGATASAGLTRPLDPINQFLAFTEGEDYVNVDRRQGNKVLNNSFRYVDEIFENLLQLDAPPKKERATTDIEKPSQFTKVLGYREIGKQTYTERMFNTIGRPNWRVGFFGKVPEADSALNQRIFYFLESRAKALMLSKGFKKLSTNEKRIKVDNILRIAKKQTKDSMKSSVIIEDRQLEKLYTLDKKYRESEIRRAMKDIDLEGDYDNLNYEQLELLEGYMDGSDDYIKRTTK